MFSMKAVWKKPIALLLLTLLVLPGCGQETAPVQESSATAAPVATAASTAGAVVTDAPTLTPLSTGARCHAVADEKSCEMEQKVRC